MNPPLYTATLVGAECLPSSLHGALQDRFITEIDRIFGGHAAAAGSLHHWEDGGLDLIEPTPWPDAVRQVTAQILAMVDVPTVAHFRCSLTDAAFEPEGAIREPAVHWPEPEHKAPF